MNKNTLLITLIFASSLITLESCAKVSRLSTSKVTDLSGRWNDTDAKLVAEEMTQDAINRVWRTNFINKSGRQPIIMVGEVINKSHEHIDAEFFIKDMEREFINTNSVRVITHGQFRDKVRRERAEQQIAVSPDMQKQFGRELGSDYMMFGTINSMVDTKAAGRNKVIFYQVNLELVDLETNEVVWIGEKKIKKYVKK
ncbi:MAG: penicillin-binding protein activator LpoB [Burkholderiales bacterium]